MKALKRVLVSLFAVAALALLASCQKGGTLAQGGTVAAPVFASVMSGTLRLMDIPPDDLQNVPAAALVQANDNP